MKSERRTFLSGAPEGVTIFFALVGMFFTPLAVSAANFYAGTSPANVPWPGGVVPYEFTNTLSAAEQQTYLDGLREWELAGNVKFVPHTTQTHWILFTYNTNGFDNVSATTNPQVVSVSSLSRAQVCHEMGHSFGFTHENIRPDAANYVTVLTNNIVNEPVNIYWFTIDPTSVPYGSYDFESVMHLGWDFDSTDPGVLATQQPKAPYFPRYQFRMGNFCLSAGDRAALAYLYGPPAAPLTNVVTTTADYGPGSLRAAIYYATDHPGTTIRFDIPTSDPGYSNGVFNIHLTGMLPPLVTDGTIIDGSTQPGFAGKPLIFIDGSQIIPETFTSDTFLIYSANNQIKNLSFSGFDWNGMTLEYADATNNTVSGCWFGLDYTGTNAAPNVGQGILIFNGASRNIIGGTNALERNVLSGNGEYGIFIGGSNTTGNVVLGNYIGTDNDGSNSVPNQSGGLILDNGTRGNLIGGAIPSARNLISGNINAGIWLTGSGTFGNTVQGNWVGLNAAGNAALANTFVGMYLIGGAQSNLVLNNVFSGQPSEGLRLSDPGTSFNVVQGNDFGTDPGGSVAIPNNYAGVNIYDGASSNLVGGTTVAARNLISGNYYNVVIDGAGVGANGNQVQGNYIGTDNTGTNGLGYTWWNVLVENGATNNSIGGSGPGMGNVIAFAASVGVVATGTNTVGNSIRGNSIFGNDFLGIDLNNDGVTLNDPGDGDTGPNDLQNFPVITNAFGYGFTTIIAGTLNSLPNQTFNLDFYRNDTPGPNGYGPGQYYLGTLSVTTDGSGNALFAYTNTVGNFAGQYIAATTTAAGGDTSEFSAAVFATNVPVAAAQFVGPYLSSANGFTFSLNLETNFSYRIQATTNLTPPIVWTNLTNFTATNSPFPFVDHSATNYRVRFYRVISP